MKTWPFWVASIASAEFFTVSTSHAQPTVTRLELLDGDELLTEEDRDTYFNIARCACDTPLIVRVSLSGQATADGRFELLYGRSCVDADGEIDEDCVSIYSADVDDVSATVEESVRVSELAGGCGTKEEGRAVYAVFDDGDDGEWSVLDSLDYEVDTEPPPRPLPVEVLAGEELAEVVFEEPDATSDVRRYQVLCTTTSTGAVPTADADFDTASDLCAIADDFGGFPPCADSETDAESVTVLGLSNGVTYTFQVVSIDDAGNPSDPVVVGDVVPAPEEDFWERYKNSGGTADGENCFVATAAFGDYDHPMVRTLRLFRDEILRPTSVGRGLIRFYYWASPGIADWIRHSALARYITQGLLWPVVLLAGVAVHLGARASGGLIVIAFVMMLSAYRRTS